MRLINMVFILVFSVTFCFVTNVTAENRAGAVSVSPFIGGYIFDDDQSIRNDPTYGVVLGYNITERIGIEGAFNYVDTDVRSAILSNDVNAYVYRLEGLYHFMADKDVLPYIAVGAGAITLDVDGSDSDTDILANYGAGIKFFLTESLALRAGVRHIISFDDTNHNILYKVGLSYLIGAKAPVDSDGDGVSDDMDTCADTAAGIKVDSVGCPVDTDGDGVSDDMDTCAGTAAGIKVDSVGCPLDSDGDGVSDDKDECMGTPAGVAVDTNGCPSDSDGDGVADNRDKCPDTPSGASVDSDGCPVDSDKDGVYDHEDNCPGTAAGIKVDAVGCPLPIKEKVSIDLYVEFVTNSATVKNTFYEPIEKVANFLKTYPDTIAVIEGHTDSKGTEEHNLRLSQMRAENVVKHLISQGIHPTRLKAVGYGESQPIADNGTAEGRQKNRRVYAVITTIVEKMP